MGLINMARKCLWARYILRFICKIIQSLPTNDRGGEKWCERTVAPQHQGPIDTEDRRPHLSQPYSNCIVGSLLSSALVPLFPIHSRSAVQTMHVLMKPSDEVAITGFCHQGQLWRRRRSGGDASPQGLLYTRCVVLDGRVVKLPSKEIWEWKAG